MRSTLPTFVCAFVGACSGFVNVAAAQGPRIRPTVALAIQSQDAGGVPRSGAALGVGAWITGHGRIHGRVEVGFGGYSLVGGGILCPAIVPSDCGGPGGFPELLTVSGGLVLGHIAPSRGPFVTLGAAAIQGFGNEGRRDRRAITPDIGVGVATGRAWFLEVRYRALAEWEGERFEQIGLSLGWRRPSS